MFIKYENNPVIKRTPGTFYSKYAANPDILEFKDKLFFYFRGQDENNHDQMGVATCTYDSFDGVQWDYIHEKPVLHVTPDPDAYDSNHILDPAACVIDDKVYLYYSSHSLTMPHSVSLAVSDDGINFVKYQNNPIVHNAVVPEVVIKEGIVHLFYQRWTAGKKGVSELCMNKSTDGISFNEQDEIVVQKPEGKNRSLSTNRICLEKNVYYGFVGINERYKDYPERIGIMRSLDLENWQMSDKTIIERGIPGTWDEGALWFATAYRHKDKYYLWYEGTGTGNRRKTSDEIIKSDTAVNESYGGYGKFSFSQIGMALYKGELSDFF